MKNVHNISYQNITTAYKTGMIDYDEAMKRLSYLNPEVLSSVKTDTIMIEVKDIEVDGDLVALFKSDRFFQAMLIAALFSIVLFSSACAPGSSGEAQAIAAVPTTEDLVPSNPPADPASPEAPQQLPPVVVDPEAPVLPPETQPPAPTPQPRANLYCYSNNGVYCTGGTLGFTVVKLDVNYMLTAGDTRYSTTVTKVTNENFAKYTEICANANRRDCYPHSACVYVITRVISNPTTYWNNLLCSDKVNTTNNTFVIHN